MTGTLVHRSGGTRRSAEGVGGLVLALLSGLALALAFPKPALDLLAWIAPTPLFVLAVRCRPLWGGLHGFAFGLGFFVPLLYWVAEVMHNHGGLAIGTAAVVLLLLSAVLSLYLGLVAGLLSRASGRYGPSRALMLAPALWVAGEFLRAQALTGFPWGLLGATVARRTVLIQAASLGGVFLVSFLIAATAAGLALAVSGSTPIQRCRGLAVSVLVPTLMLLGGAVSLARSPTAGTGSLRAAVVQGNLGAIPGTDGGALAVYDRLTRAAGATGAELVIWPESAVHGLILSRPGWPREWIRELAARSGATLVVNDVTYQADGTYRNGAVPVRPDGRLGPWYEKLHLVPFGEYVPLQRFLPFVRHFTDEVGDFRPGEETVLLEAAGTRLGVLICYEAIFPELSAGAVSHGAEIMINLTNDGWFGRSAGPLQHLDLATVRAVETRRPLLRAASTGVSVAVDGWGRRLAVMPVGYRGLLVADVEPARVLTPAVRLGHALPWTCAIVSLLSLLPRIRRRGPQHRRVEPLHGSGAR